MSVPEPTNEEVVQILRGIARKYEVRCWWGWMLGLVSRLACLGTVEIEPRNPSHVQVPHPSEDLAQTLTGSPRHPLLRRSLAILREVCVAVHPGTDGSNHQRSSTSHESVAARCSHMTSATKKCWHLEPPDHQIMRTLSGQDRYLLDKAIHLLDETGAQVQWRSRVRIEKKKQPRKVWPQGH